MRHALPPLHDKEVELVSITKQNMLDDVWSVRLLVNGLPYRVFKQKCRDEIDVMLWLLRLQNKEQEHGNESH